MATELQREYETIYILRPGTDQDARAKARERVDGILNNSGGHVLKFDDWGDRRLAYRIRDREGTHHGRGLYQYYRYLAPGDAVQEIERNLRILDDVLKFVTVKLDEDLVPEERIPLGVPEEPEDEDGAQYQDEEEDEEE